MKSILTAAGCFALMLAAFAETENLVKYGDFEAPPAALKKLFTGKGKLSFIQEEPGDNHCAKVEIVKFSTDKFGQQNAHASISFGVSGLKPGVNYRFSFDLTGSAPRFLLTVREKEGDKLELKASAGKKKSGSYLEITPDWKEYSFRFKAVKGGRCIITMSMWHNTRYGKMFYSAGDYFLLDNITLTEIQ